MRTWSLQIPQIRSSDQSAWFFDGMERFENKFPFISKKTKACRKNQLDPHFNASQIAGVRRTRHRSAYIVAGDPSSTYIEILSPRRSPVADRHRARRAFSGTRSPMAPGSRGAERATQRRHPTLGASSHRPPHPESSQVPLRPLRYYNPFDKWASQKFAAAAAKGRADGPSSSRILRRKNQRLSTHSRRESSRHSLSRRPTSTDERLAKSLPLYGSAI